MNIQFSDNSVIHAIDSSIQNQHTLDGEESFVSQQNVDGELFIFSVHGVVRIFDKLNGKTFIGKQFFEHVNYLNLPTGKRLNDWLYKNENDQDFDDRFEIFSIPCMFVFNRFSYQFLDYCFRDKNKNEELIRNSKSITLRPAK